MSDLIGVILGGALALSGGAISKVWEARRQRKALAHALAGEIYSIVEMVELRGYANWVAHLENRFAEQGTAALPRIAVTHNYFVVYEANAGNIGSLPSGIAREVASFYTHAKALVEDATVDATALTSEDAAARLAQVKTLLGKLTEKGKAAVEQLQNL